MSSEGAHVLIIGAGVAGLRLARGLSSQAHFRVTVVDPKNYFELKNGMFKAYCDPAHHDNLAFALGPVLDKMGVTFVQGEVLELRKDCSCTVTRRNGAEETIFADYVALCSGCSFGPHHKWGESLWSPTVHGVTRQESEWRHFDERSIDGRRSHIEDVHKRLKNLESRSGTVLVVGAGYLGAELATDLQHYFPGLRITVTDFLPRSLGPFPDAAADYCEAYMDKVGIKHVYQVKYDPKSKRFWEQVGLPNGADLELVVIGVKASPRYMPAEILSAKGPGGGGWILFNRKMQVVDRNSVVWGDGKIFTAGDCSYSCIGNNPWSNQEEVPPFPKTLYAAEATAAVACRNIIALHSHTPTERLTSLTFPKVAGSFEVSLGPNDGCCISGVTWVKGAGAVTSTGSKAVAQKQSVEVGRVKRYQLAYEPRLPASCFGGLGKICFCK